MTPGQLQDLLVATLTRTAGGSQRRWRLAVGPVRVYDRATHAHCNWSVTPSGNPQEVAAIESLIDGVRASHPFVRGG
ncbi:hypothetical protein [Sphingomonas sp.]|uniref:hypothetical protein n=1 Tax=Sphingomonas sp. TaxID=28214 RepID=UPI002C4A5566|nr:hypothetical protein [Sphingomonas sp.]HTG38172.1 hypothetical protein [Sphingomonas sp.]